MCDLSAYFTDSENEKYLDLILVYKRDDCQIALREIIDFIEKKINAMKSENCPQETINDEELLLVDLLGKLKPIEERDSSRSKLMIVIGLILLLIVLYRIFK